MADINKLEKIASQIRRDIIRQVANAQSGHPGGSLGCADLLVALYFHHMTHDPSFRMDGKGEDMFYLSNGHISPVFYSVLARSGYFPVEELATFRQLNSRLQGHPATHEGLPGVRTASGSLGQGLSVAIGAALAKRLDGDDKLVYCLMGDGEQQEGQIWEAVMFAPHHKIDNLIAIVDRNNQQIDGSLTEVLDLGDLGAKYAQFGWEVLRMDGNNMAEVVSTIDHAKALSGKGKPIMIDMTTVMGKGVDYMEGTHKWHGKAPDAELTARALAQLEETLGDF
ncbi:MAG: transketolase [Bacteroidetes bacterium]|nr:MAG: transketolase [Bacteroidota bacterium]